MLGFDAIPGAEISVSDLYRFPALVPVPVTPKMHAVDAKMGGVRRSLMCISITEDDKDVYCGTRTGDVLKFRIDRDEIRVGDAYRGDGGKRRGEREYKSPFCG